LASPSRPLRFPAPARPDPAPPADSDSRRLVAAARGPAAPAPRTAPPPRSPMTSPAQPIQFPARADDPMLADQFQAAPGPRHAAPATRPQEPVARTEEPTARPEGETYRNPVMPDRLAQSAAREAAQNGGDWRVSAAPRGDDPLLDCLVIMTALFERPHSAESLTAGLPLVNHRLTPDLFARAAARAGLSSRVLKRAPEDISGLSLPCILLLRDARACVLVRVNAGVSAAVVLPETGQGVTEISWAQLQERYTGFAIFARPEYQYDARSQATEIKPSQDWFWGTLARFKSIYVKVLLAAVLVNLFAVALPLFTMNVYDRVVPTKGQETLWVLVLGIAIVFLFEFLLRWLRAYFIDLAGRSADVIMASRVFQQVMNLRMDARPQSAGAFAQQLRDFESVRDFFTSATLVALVDLPFVLLFVAIVWLIGGPFLAMVPIVGAVAIVLLGLSLQKPLNRIVTRSSRESAQKHAMLVESIVGLETIKGLGAEGRTQRNWERFVGVNAKSAAESREISQLAQYLTNLVSQFVSVAVVIVGVYEIFAGTMSVGALIACTILTGRAMAPMTQVAGLLTRLDQSIVARDTIDKIMKMPVERPAGKQFVHRPVLRGQVEFKDVGFAYPGQQVAALENVSFAVKPGERVGIIGKIGSGKSTLEKLLLGFYEPQKGSVRVDGIDLKQVDPADLRRNIGYVPQDVFLFFGSVRDNIMVGAPHADDAAILRAARIAGVDGFVARHPHGFDLQVGEGGHALSGGQRQAIAIARALIRDPNILILDEPTSAMDKGSEDWFIARLREIMAGKTLLLVTQRLSLLTLVDRVIVMDGGRAVADGPRDAILETLAKGQIRGAA
jgi:ATP-binding cassette subfamily C protein LapB